jgi:hypothetical protein
MAINASVGFDYGSIFAAQSIIYPNFATPIVNAATDGLSYTKVTLDDKFFYEQPMAYASLAIWSGTAVQGYDATPLALAPANDKFTIDMGESTAAATNLFKTYHAQVCGTWAGDTAVTCQFRIIAASAQSADAANNPNHLELTFDTASTTVPKSAPYTAGVVAVGSTVRIFLGSNTGTQRQTLGVPIFDLELPAATGYVFANAANNQMQGSTLISCNCAGTEPIDCVANEITFQSFWPTSTNQAAVDAVPEAVLGMQNTVTNPLPTTSPIQLIQTLNGAVMTDETCYAIVGAPTADDSTVTTGQFGGYEAYETIARSTSTTNPCELDLWEAKTGLEIGAVNGKVPTFRSKVVHGYTPSFTAPSTTVEFEFVCGVDGSFDATASFQCTPHTVNMDVPKNWNGDTATWSAGYLDKSQSAASHEGIDFSGCNGMKTGDTCYPTCETGFTATTTDADGFRVLAGSNGALYVNNYLSNGAINAALTSNTFMISEAQAGDANGKGPATCFSTKDEVSAACDDVLDGRGPDVASNPVGKPHLSSSKIYPSVRGRSYAESMTLECTVNSCWKGPDPATLAAYPGVNWAIDTKLDPQYAVGKLVDKGPAGEIGALAGVVLTVTITVGGTGYTALGTGALTGGTGTGATYEATTVTGAQAVATVTIVAGGSGYTVGDVLTLAGGGGDATITVATTSGLIEGVEYTIYSQGSTDFTLQGAADNTPGTTFTANAVAATGTGIVRATSLERTQFLVALTASLIDDVYIGWELKFTDGAAKGQSCIISDYEATDEVATAVDATAFVAGTLYTIVNSPYHSSSEPGETEFTKVGAPNNNVGTTFRATGPETMATGPAAGAGTPGGGTGTATENSIQLVTCKTPLTVTPTTYGAPTAGGVSSLYILAGDSYEITATVTYQSVLDALPNSANNVPTQNVQFQSFNSGNLLGSGRGAASDDDWGIDQTLPCLVGYVQIPDTVIPTLTAGETDPLLCSTSGLFTITSGFTNICAPNVAMAFYTRTATGTAEPYQGNGYLYKSFTEQGLSGSVSGGIVNGAPFQVHVIDLHGLAPDVNGHDPHHAPTFTSNLFNGKDYTPCMGLKSGELCTPKCMGGFAVTSPAVSFKAEVNTAGQMLVGKQDFYVPAGEYIGDNALIWDVRTGGSTWYAIDDTLECTPYVCDAAKVKDGGDFVSYTSCSMEYSMSTCKPMCGTSANDPATTEAAAESSELSFKQGSNFPTGLPPGIAGSGGAVLKTKNDLSIIGSEVDLLLLVCNADGSFQGASATQTYGCTANSCDFAKETRAYPTLDFTSCLGMKSNDTCVPTCASGFATGTQFSFLPAPQLECSEAGDFLEPSVARATLVAQLCTPKACTGPNPATTNPLLNYGKCNSGKATGQSCDAIACQAGYSPSAATATVIHNIAELVCDSTTGLFADPLKDEIVCEANTCTAGFMTTPFIGVDSNINTTKACHGIMTGGTCSIECKEGFGTVIAGDPFVLSEAVDGALQTASLHCTSASNIDDEMFFGLYPRSTLVFDGQASTATNSPVYEASPLTGNTGYEVDFKTEANSVASFTAKTHTGTISAVTLATAGIGYAAATTYNLISSGYGTGATCTVTETAGIIQTITVVGTGTGYAAGETVVITDGSGASSPGWGTATVTTVVSDGELAVTEVLFGSIECGDHVSTAYPGHATPATVAPADIVGFGSAYSALDTGALTGGTGTGATYKVTTVQTLSGVVGAIDAVEIETGGSGYKVGDVLTLAGNGVNKATIKVTTTETITRKRSIYCDENGLFVNGGGAFDGGGVGLYGLAEVLTPTVKLSSISPSIPDTAPHWYIIRAPTGITGRSIFPTCMHGVCDATNVINAIPGMNYANPDCAPAATGSTCTYQCNQGYTFAAIGAAQSTVDFKLACDHSESHFTDPNGAGGMITCTANACEEPLVAASGTWELGSNNPSINYDDCTTPGKKSGSTCTPACQDGYSPVNVASVKTLVCGTNPSNGPGWDKAVASDEISKLGYPTTFQFDAATDLTCGRTCNWSVISTTTANADYSSCLGKGDGYTCTPTCATGYVATTAATGIVLNCDDGGSVAAPGLMVTPWSAADATLVCEAGVAPTAGPATAAPTTAAPAPVPHTHTPAPIVVAVATNGKAGKDAGGKVRKEHRASALQQSKSSSAARKPSSVAYAASGVAVVLVLAAAVGIATKHGIGPLAKKATTLDEEPNEGRPLLTPGVHPIYA